MTDAHCHLPSGEAGVRELVAGRDCFGVHPWNAESFDEAELRRRLAENPAAGVGEIGLDRLRARRVTDVMRDVFVRQLRVAAELRRPVTLHGAKCWGDVVQTIRALFPDGACPIPAFLFHGFSRSDGLLPDIARLNGFVSVGPAVLNDHAVNYRALVRKIPAERLLVETDRTPERAGETPSVRAVLARTAEIRGVTAAELEAQTDANARRFSIMV